MKKTLIIVGRLLCTLLLCGLGVHYLYAAFMTYTGVSAVASFLASLVYFIFGYAGACNIAERLTKWVSEDK